MKNLKQSVITSLVVLFTTLCFAQKTLKDSLTVKIDEKIEVKMGIYDYSGLKESVEKDLKALQEILKVNKDVPQNTPHTITYEPYKKLSIKNSEKTETIIWEDGKYTPFKFENKCEVLSSKYQMDINFNDLEDLISENLIAKIKEAIDSTKANQKRYSSLVKYSFEKDSLVKRQSKNISRTGDMLSLTAGVGANLIKNQPIIDLSGEVAFTFQKKGILKNQYYLSYNVLYDFIENSKANLNSFLNLGFRYNFSNTKDDSDWLGVELGYLVSREGDMFDDNTFKFGINWDVGNSITVSPQLYISKEQTFPALRIGFGF